MQRTSIYQQVTQQIIEQLEQGVAPWQKPWAAVGCGTPTSVSGRLYRGVNILLLWAAAQKHGFESSIWGTFNQWKNLGGFVRRGEKGTKVVFWRIEEADDRNGDEHEQRRFFARQHTVFNLSQCGGDALDRFRTVQPVSDFVDFQPAEEAIAATGAEIHHGGNKAFYSPADDFIQLPIKSTFKNQAAYYSTALHELIHWSGSELRLNRIDKLARFGSHAYAAEELVAEMGSAFLTASLGIANTPIQNNAAYLQNWLEVLQSDSRAIFTAATAASKAADYVLAFSRELEPAEPEEELVAA